MGKALAKAFADGVVTREEVSTERSVSRILNILSDKTVDRFAKYGVNVFDLDANQDKFDIANQAIDANRKILE